MSDKELVDCVLTNDTHAFAILIQNTERIVASIIFKMIENNEDRKDLAQDVYLKVYGKLRSFRFQSRLSTWIAQITFNTCLDHLKKKKVSLTGDLYGESEIADSVETLAGINQTQLKEILHAAIERLSPLYKTLITLYHHEDMSYDELRQITGLPEGTIKSYLFRARKLLRNDLLNTYKKDDL